MIAKLLKDLTQHHLSDISNAPDSVKQFIVSIHEICKKPITPTTIHYHSMTLPDNNPTIGTWEIDMNFITDFHLIPFSWSDETYQILGYEIGSILPSGHTFTAFVHPDDKQIVMNTIFSALMTRGENTISYRLLLPGNVQKNLRLTVAPHFDPKTGFPDRITGTLQHIDTE
jgi:PAS fold